MKLLQMWTPGKLQVQIGPTSHSSCFLHYRTDNLIQRTIRRKFGHCTVLTIAHRLNTIMDSNRVLVMSRGEILEFDHPHNLLQNPKGYFTRMVMETGTSMTEQLRNVALTAWNERDEDEFFA